MNIKKIIIPLLIAILLAIPAAQTIAVTSTDVQIGNEKALVTLSTNKALMTQPQMVVQSNAEALWINTEYAMITTIADMGYAIIAKQNELISLTYLAYEKAMVIQTATNIVANIALSKIANIQISTITLQSANQDASDSRCAIMDLGINKATIQTAVRYSQNGFLTTLG